MDDPGTQKRRSTRIVKAVPITVTGVDALGQPFKERTTTVMVNCHGCKYQSKHYVPKNSMVTLEVPRPEAGQKRTTRGRGVWVQRPRTVRDLFQIGLEFEGPGNVWGIAFPPEDWFSSPYDAGIEGSTPAGAQEAKLSVAPTSAVPGFVAPRDPHNADTHPSADKTPGSSAPVKPAAPEHPAAAHPGAVGSGTPAAPRTPQEFFLQKPPATTVVSPPSSTPASAPASPSTPSGSAEEAKIHVVAPTSAEMQGPLARQMAQMVDEVKEKLDKSLRRGAEAAITEEMAVARQQLDSQLHDAIERAIKVSMERVSESSVKRVVQQATERTAAIVEEARKATEASAIHIDEKIREAVQQAVTGAAEQAAQQAAERAAQQAAEHTAAHSLKQAVDEAVDRALVERAASTPSLEILSSPEAAQQHLDQWRKSLEETAQGVRNSTVEQSQAELAAANERWKHQFETGLAGAAHEFDERINQASHKIGEKISEVSQQTIDQAEQSIRERSESLRNSLDEGIDGAASTIESLGNSLKQERDRAEEAKSQLQGAAKVTLEQTRQHLDELLVKQQQEIGRTVDQAIAERVQQIEPALDASAQKVLARVSAELDQRITPKLEAVEGLASRLDNVENQAANLQNHIREQMRQATEQAAQ